MSNRILFGEKLRYKLDDVLRQAGFQLVEAIVEPSEFLKYERKRSSTSKPDVITFHGLGKNHPNYIFSDAATAVGDGFFLKNIKELLPHFMTLPIRQANRWIYNSNEELDTCLDEIYQVVKDRLLKWFDVPTNSPSGAAISSKVSMSKEEMRAKLQEQIKIFELALQRAQTEGRTEDIERYGRTINLFKEKLSTLKSDGV